VAENAAYAALNKVFVASVEQVAKDFMGAYSTSGGKSLEVQSSEQLTKVSTTGVLKGVNIAELWEDKGTTYAFACLERAKTVERLRGEIMELDKKAQNALDKAEGADAASKVKSLSKAMDALVQREVLNGELRIVDPDGVGLGSPLSYADISNAFDEAVAALRVGVRIKGAHADDFKNAITQGLTDRGWQLVELSSGDDDEDEEPSDEPLDVEIGATVKMENATTDSKDGISYVRGVVDLTIKNVKKNKIIATMNESRREGHKSLPEAERRAVRELAKKLAGQVGAEIDAKMKGK
jgi:hypothetical protein